MADFYIQIKNNKAQTSRIINGEPEVIRFAGEVWISTDAYWEEFQRKIEYLEHEQLAFIIDSDAQPFEIDSTILISDKFSNNDQDLQWFIDSIKLASNLPVFYPDISESLNLAKTEDINYSTFEDKNIEQVAETELDDLNSNSLQNHYRKMTREFKKGN